MRRGPISSSASQSSARSASKAEAKANPETHERSVASRRATRRAVYAEATLAEIDGASATNARGCGDDECGANLDRQPILDARSRVVSDNPFGEGAFLGFQRLELF